MEEDKMWALNLCLPTGFIVLVLSVINFLDLGGPSSDPDQPAAGESIGDSDEAYAATKGDTSLCRLTLTMVVLLTIAVLGCFLIGCLSARVSTFLVAFMLGILGITCMNE
jgi:hypothetical protein